MIVVCYPENLLFIISTVGREMNNTGVVMGT